MTSFYRTAACSFITPATVVTIVEVIEGNLGMLEMEQDQLPFSYGGNSFTTINYHIFNGASFNK